MRTTQHTNINAQNVAFDSIEKTDLTDTLLGVMKEKQKAKLERLE